MNSQSTSQQKQEEACTYRYLKDRSSLEQRQDDARMQQKVLQEVDQQILADAQAIHAKVEEYAHTRDIHLYQAMTSCQNQIYDIQAQASKHFEQSQEELTIEERKLSAELEERQQAYKQELRNLGDDNNRS